MKFIFLLGGAIGFSLTAAASWGADHAADRVLFDAAVGCLAGAVLFRWFWKILVHAMRETIRQRHASATAATTAAAGKAR